MMIRKISTVFLVMASAAIMFNCSSDDAAPATAVYLAGQSKVGSDWVCSYSKNGVFTTLNSDLGIIEAITFSGKDFYMAGNVDNVATYWKNGTPVTIPLLEGSYSSDSRGGMVVVGKDVYVAGMEATPTGDLIKYWKNGVGTVCELPVPGPAGTSSYGTALAVDGADVYVAGSAADANGSVHAGYWKNGTFVFFPQLDSYGRGIAIVDGDIYVAGFYIDQDTYVAGAAYWKNGVMVKLSTTNDAAIFALAEDIEVTDGHVYVCGNRKYNGGSISKAVYWKDGVETILTPDGTEAYAHNIEVKNGDVYVVGEDIINNYYQVHLWKNDVLRIPFDGTATDFYGMALYVK